jgi:hypothetical protein
MTSASRSVSPAGRSIRGTCWPAASRTAVTASASSRPARASPVRVSAARSGRNASRFGHGVIGVGGGEQACRRSERRGGSSAVVAGAVTSLVMGSSDRSEHGEAGRAGEHTLRVIRVQPDSLPFVRRQRPGFLPDPNRDRDSPEIMDERRAPNGDKVSDAEMPPLGGRRHELRDPRRVTDEVGRGEIGEVPHRRESAVDRLAPQDQRRRRLTGERFVPRGCIGLEGEDLRGLTREQPSDGGVEGAPRSLADDARSPFPAAQHVLEGRVSSDVNDPQRQRDLVAFQAARFALAVPALGEMHPQRLQCAG